MALTARRSLLLLILIGMGMLYPLWTTSEMIYSNHSDLIAEHIGIKVIGRQALAEGRLPLWNPSQNSGAPAFANPQSMYFFPFDLLFFVLPLGLAANLVILLNFLAAGVAMLLFSRRYLHPAAALLAATAYLLSYRYLTMIYCGWLPKMSMLALTPLLFWACDRLLDRPTRPRLAALALIGALALLQGDMQQLYYAGVAGIVWVLFRLSAAEWREQGRTLGRLALAGLLAAMLAAPALLPRLQFVGQSTRTEPSHEFLLQDSPAPAELATFFDPHTPGGNGDVRYQFWENNFYFGAWMSPLWLLAFWGRRRRALVLALGLGLIVLLSFDTALLRACYDHLPGFNLFRQSSRMLLLGQFGAVLLAGLGADVLLAAAPVPRVRLIFAVGSLAVAAIGWLVPLPWPHPELAWDCALIALTGGAALFSACPPLLLGGLLLLAPVLDAGLRIEPLLATAPLAGALPPHGYDSLLRRSPDSGRVLAVGTDVFRARSALLYTTAAYYGIDMLNGGVALELRDYIEYFTVLEYGSLAALPHHPIVWTDCRQIAHPDMLRALDVRNVIGDSALNLENARMGATRVWENPRTEVYFQGIRARPLAVWHLDDPLGPAYFATSVRPVWTEAESLQRLVAATSVRDATVLGADAGLPRLDFTGGTASFLERGYNRYRYRVETPGRNFLILSQVWYPGWAATLDGAPIPLYRTNHALLGCVIPPGRHELVLEMTCAPLRYGLWAAAFALAALGALLAGRPISLCHSGTDAASRSTS